MESPLAIANYFIRKANETAEEMTSMKLIKLVYISHGWYLALTDTPLLTEAIEAWKYGPVVKTVYNGTKQYGSNTITELLYDPRARSYPMPTDQGLYPFLDKIWELYGHYNGLELSALTHQDGSPWYITWNTGDNSKRNSVTIGNDLIKNHYKSKLNPVPNGAPATP